MLSAINISLNRETHEGFLFRSFSGTHGLLIRFYLNEEIYPHFLSRNQKYKSDTLKADGSGCFSFRLILNPDGCKDEGKCNYCHVYLQCSYHVSHFTNEI